MKRRNEKLKLFYAPIKDLFSGLQIFFHLIFIFTISTTYLYLTTQSLKIAVAVSFITMFFSFYFLVFIPKKIQRENHLLKELQKYATNMTFYLKSGYNVLKALEGSKKNLDPEIQRDIDKTISILKEKAELNTEHFRKYNFYSIDVFHQILRIKYEKGGKAGNLFTKVNQAINFEIVKRDELYRRKRLAKKQITTMMLMVLSMPIIIYLFAKDLYLTFLSLGFLASGLVVLIYSLILISMFFLQRASTELSLRY